MIAHRRWGKDDVALHHTACAAHERVGNYVHMLPAYEQARKAIWTAVSPHTGKRRIDEAFPEVLRRRTRDDEMFIEFGNGSTWQVAGSDSYNRLVGASFAGVVYSEYALSNPAAQGYFTPMLIENKGWEILITTPRGKNHGYAMYEHARKQQALGRDWYAELAGVDRTQALDQGMLDDELHRLQSLHGEDYGRALWLQEYYCSFDAAIPGSIFGDCMVRMKNEGRLGTVPLLPEYPVHTGWDLGRTDDTAIWWFQLFGGEVRVVDFHASSLKDVPFYAKLLDQKRQERGMTYGTNYLPHDARPRTFASPRSILQQFMEENTRVGGRLGQFQIAPRLDKQEQIQAARATLHKTWMDAETCKDGVEALQHYHREWDDELKKFIDKPVHDWSSHPCDALMTAAVAWRLLRHGTTDERGASQEGRRGASILPDSFGAMKRQHLRRARERREAGIT